MVYTSPLKIDGLVQMIFLFKDDPPSSVDFFWGGTTSPTCQAAGAVAKVKLLELRQGDRICVRAGEAGCFSAPNNGWVRDGVQCMSRISGGFV